MTPLLWTLIAIQIAMGVFDTFYHHEFTERLAWRPSQRYELKLHGLRNMLYALQVGPLRLALPDWLTPGDLTVTHSDLGGGTFRFTLEIIHPRFGKLIRQSAVFREAAP